MDSKKVKPVVRNKNEEILLERQKDVAIAILKDSAIYKQDQELVRDDTYNANLIQKIDSVNLKIDQLDMLFT